MTAGSQGKANGNTRWIGTRPVRPDGVDKVTGRARFGADVHLPNMLVGKVLRSPHAHARIRSVDMSAALALPGVKAVVTRDDFSDLPSEFVPAGEMMVNYRDIVRNVMAREKVLYEGHPVAAVAAVSEKVAKEALDLVRVEYEVLPHVLDVVEAMARDAPLLHEDMITAGVEPAPSTPSNVAKVVEFGHGDVEAGFVAADLVIEREFRTQPVHQGYIEPHSCIASFSEDGQAELWCTTQGHFVVRGHCAKLLGMEVSKLRVTASEIGGGFGGKTVVYLEPLALMLSRKSGHPVKMTMSREEVFRASGPAPGTCIWVKVGVTKEGRITAGEAVLKYQAGAFQGSPVQPGCMCAFAPYDVEHVKIVGYDVVVNRPKAAAYRAPGAPQSEFAVESVIDELAKRIGMDPVVLRLKNAAKEGTQAAYGPYIRADRTGRDAGGRPKRTRTTAHRSLRVVAGAWHPDSGSTSVAKPVRRSISVRTAPSRSSPELRTSAVRAQLFACRRRKRSAWTWKGSDHSSETPVRWATRSSPAAAAPHSRAAWRWSRRRET